MPTLLAIPFESLDVAMWAAPLAVLPIVIHLLMRSKPRLVVFPAMRFVKMMHNAHVARHRLKHLLLLLMRMAAVALVALVLARPKIQAAGNVSLRSNEPESIVVIMDTSGSMAYGVPDPSKRKEHPYKSRLEEAREQAGTLLKTLNRPGDEVALLWPDFTGKEARFVAADHVLDQINAIEPQTTAQPNPAKPTYRPGQRARMGALIAKAYASLAAAHNTRREIYIFNDGTADSWSDVIGAGQAGRFRRTELPSEAHHDRIIVRLVDVGAGENRDFQLIDIRGRNQNQLVSVRQTPTIMATLRNGQLSGSDLKRTIVATSDGTKIGDAEVTFARPRDTFQQRIDPETQPEGLHQVTVSLKCDDEILEDNTRYVAMDVGSLPTVLMIESERMAANGVASVGDLVQWVLAPAKMVSMDQALVKLERIQASEAAKLITDPAGQKKLADAHAVFLADVRELGDELWSALENYVGGGGTLIILLGPNTEPDKLKSRAALAVLPAGSIEPRAKFDAKSAPAPAYPPFDKHLSQVLEVYRENVIDPKLDRAPVYQYYPVGKTLPADTTPLIWLAGKTPDPLLLERRLGSGHSLLLTTTGLGDWSTWSQAENDTMLSLIYSMTLAYPRRQQRAYQFTLDQSGVVTAPAEFRTATASVDLPDARGSEKLDINATNGAIAVPTRFLGHYKLTLRSSGRNDETILYAVNFDPDEYALEKADTRELERAFPPNCFRVTGRDHGPDSGDASTEDYGPLVALALLLLLVGESFFSNRFYRPAGASPVTFDKRGQGGRAGRTVYETVAK
jgi:hypothetical protein